VDDAIVMLENIHRHMEMGKPRRRAAIEASREIGFAIVATTITLVAVFVPVAFLQGQVGRLFSEFGVAVAVSVLISGFVALTLTPMLCSRFLSAPHGHADESGTGAVAPPPRGFRAMFDRGFDNLSRGYDWTLRFAIGRRWLVMGVTAVLVVAIGVLFRFLPSETVPTEDRGWIFNVIRAPEGATLEYTDRYVRVVEGMYDKLPAKDRMFTAVGLFGPVTDGFMFVGLKPKGQRPPAQALAGQMFPQLFSIPGVMAFAFNPPSLSGGFGQPVQFVLKADSYDELTRSVGLMTAEAQKLGYLVNMDSDLKLNKPQLEIQIDRERASELGVSVSDIGNTLQVLLGGSEVTRFKRGNHQYEVMLQLPKADRSSPTAINDLYVRGPHGLVQLASVVRVEEKVSARELNHFNRVRAATLSASLAPGVTIGKAITDLTAISRRVLPPGVQTDLAGESREYAESSSGLNFLFVIALVFIFLVLAAQFESFIHPMTILFSVPLAVFGALMTLFIFRMTINIFSQVGLIMLIGLVTKNAILIVEYANQRREAGESVVDAVISASRIRLRPILMTTLATIFGILPIALGLGAGAESRQPLGMSVVGGMLFSTFLTLVVVPVVYTMLARFSPARAKATVDDTVVYEGAPAHAAVRGAESSS